MIPSAAAINISHRMRKEEAAITLLHGEDLFRIGWVPLERSGLIARMHAVRWGGGVRPLYARLLFKIVNSIA